MTLPNSFTHASMLLFFGLISASANAATDQSRVSEWVQQQMTRESTVPVLIRLHDGVSRQAWSHIDSPLARRTMMVNALRQQAEASQQNLVRLLIEEGIAHRSFWVVNMIQADLTADLIEQLSKHPDVAYLHANPNVKANLPETNPLDLLNSAAFNRAVESSLSHVGADQLWSMGVRGQGIVIGGQDTGYQWDHPALIDSYRGNQGGTPSHDYHWHDAIHSGGGICGADSVVPCDDHNHGTHTMGTMTGDDGAGNQIGMAPGATWIGCRNMDQGNGTPATYSECFEWFLAPTDLNGNNPDPAMAPHVINNSWGCPPSEGCTDPAVMQTVVETVRAAGIMVVVSAGNSGSSCSSVETPAAIYDASFTVGNTRLNDAIHNSSSRGPVSVDGSNRLKPDISAPGTSIRSSIRGGAYASFTGTSMSGPHVAGHMALLMSADPSLIGQVNTLEQLTRDSAVPLTSTQNCGGLAGQSPNHVFGHGRINSRAAFELLDNRLFSDGFESL